MTYSSYELKYCERCGGLGMRRDQAGAPYCRSCAQMMQNFLIVPPAVPGQLGARALMRLRPLLLKPQSVSTAREASYVV